VVARGDRMHFVRRALRYGVAVTHPDGTPPYRVRWLDDDHESLLIPPPDTRLHRPRRTAEH